MRAVSAEAEAAMQRGVMKAATFLKDRSQELVPVETGALRDSWYIVRTADKAGAMVGYDRPYAVYVHEDLMKFHKFPTCAKFLEIPARVYAKDMQKIIADEIENSQRSLLSKLFRRFFS